MSSKRNQLPATSKNQDRDRTRGQPRPHPQAQHGRRNNPNPSYPSQTTYTQNHLPPTQGYNTYLDDEGMNDQYDVNYSRRMPSARISEVDSQDGYTESPSHYPMEVYDESGEYVESGKALVKHDRRSDSRQSDRSTASQVYSQGQGYEEVSFSSPCSSELTVQYPIAPAPKHPSAHRLRQPTKVNDTKSSTHREPIGKSMAPKAFKPVRQSSHFDPNPQARDQDQDQDQDQYGNSQDAYEDLSSPYESEPTPPQGDNDDTLYALKPNFQPTRSKLNQLTTFDTPSEKGSRGNAPSTIASNHSRSSAASALGRRGRGLQTEIQPLADSPTAPVKVGRHRNIPHEANPVPNVKNDFSAGFDIDPDFQDQDTSDDFLDSSPLKPTQVTSLLTPPSDRSLALGKSKVKLAKQAKSHPKMIATSDEVDPLDPRNIDGLLDLIETPDVVSSALTMRMSKKLISR